jgi:hypothetical protein
MHKKGKVRNEKNKCCTRKPRRQTCSEERCWRWKRERRGGDAEGRDAEHRARDGASLCNRCELKHLWHSMKTVLTGIQCKGGLSGGGLVVIEFIIVTWDARWGSPGPYSKILCISTFSSSGWPISRRAAPSLAGALSRSSEGQYSVTQFGHQVFGTSMRCALPHAKR